MMHFRLTFNLLCVFVIVTGHVSDVLEETDESSTIDEENTELDAGPVTEQVMEPNITMNRADELTYTESDEIVDPDWDVQRAIKDLAYFLRAHKFQDYDRRYYKSIDDAPKQLHEEFPKPPLRSMHWEVHKHCDGGFRRCLRYLERIAGMASLRRQDDTVTIMKDQKWSLTNNTQQILAAQRDCQMARRRDNLTMVPFEGPIERFQWRTSASYFMCWYTMLGTPELSAFGESCDNHAYCLDVYGMNNKDPRANDARPFACSLYSFCPDHCCPMKHIWYMRDCFQSRTNPCYEANRPADRKCSLDREENQDLQSLIGNHINVSCECRERGYEWSSRFGICVDVNECTQGQHNCDLDAGQSCINLPGSFDCVCSLGLVFSAESRSCVSSPTFKKALGPDDTDEEESEKKEKSVFTLILNAVTRSSAASSRQQLRRAVFPIPFGFLIVCQRLLMLL